MLQAMEQTGFDSANGTAQRSGDPFEGFVRVEAQVKNLALFSGQSLQAFHDLAGLLAIFSRAVRANDRVLDISQVSFGFQALGRPEK